MRHRARRGALAAAVALLPLAAATPATAAPTPAQVSTCSASDTPGGEQPAGPVAAQLVSLTPAAPQQHTQVSVTAQIVNTGTDPISDLVARLRLSYEPEPGRADVAADAADQRPFRSNVPVGGAWVDDKLLAAGSCLQVTLSIDTDDVGFGDFGDPAHPGVYRLGVEVDRTVDETDLEPLARANTLIPWMPSGSYQPLQLAWLWPMVDQPQQLPDGTLRTDDLAAELADTGRLATLLADGQDATSQSGTTSLPTPPAAASHKPGVTAPPAPTLQTRPVPLTYVVDPALLEAVATMAAGPYHVKHGDKTVTTSSGTAAAKAFLSGLSAEVGGSGPATVLALPYADPDVSAIVRAGADELLRSADNARDAVLARTGLPRTPAIASWPPTGYITQPALDELSTPAVVLAGAAVPARSNYTPTAVTELPRAGGPVTAIVTDEGLQQIVTAPVHSPADILGLRQRFLAETAMIVAEQPSRVRTAVIAPPHQFDPRGTLAGELLALSGSLPWVQPVSLADVAQSPVDATSRRGLRYPKAARAAELPAALVRRADETADRVAALGTLLCATPAQGGGDCHPDDVTLPMERALLAAVSATWRADLPGGRALADGVASRVERLFGQVRVTSAGTVTLLSQSGSIPVTIANDLTVPVTVRLHITTPNPAQLSVQPDRTYVIAAGDKSQQTIQAHTASAGRARFPIYVQLETPTGAPIGAPTELIVRSSSYGIIAVAITGGALAVLFGAVAVRLTRTALRARRSPPGEPADGSRDHEPAPASSGLDE